MTTHRNAGTRGRDQLFGEKRYQNVGPTHAKQIKPLCQIIPLVEPALSVSVLVLASSSASSPAHAPRLPRDGCHKPGSWSFGCRVWRARLETAGFGYSVLRRGPALPHLPPISPKGMPAPRVCPPQGYARPKGQPSPLNSENRHRLVMTILCTASLKP